jgi:arginine exporter protein ArgO
MSRWWSPCARSPTWRVLDAGIAAVMITLAASLLIGG